MITREIKISTVVKLLLLSFFLLSSGVTHSQQYYAIEVKGFVKDDSRRKLKNTKITLRSKSKKADTVIVAESGEFTLFLEFDKDYTIEMSKNGYISKKIGFSTRKVPDKDKKEAHGFEFELSLFKEMEGFDGSVFKKPVAKVIYNLRKRYFDYDDVYTEQQQTRIHKAYQRQLKYMKRAVKSAMLKRDSLLLEIGQIDPTGAEDAKQIIARAKQQADSILTAARISSNISSLITLYDTIVKRTGLDISDIQEEELDITLSEFESKSMEEIQIMLEDSNELIKRKRQIQTAKKQLGEDRLSATSKTDILIINEREATINAEEIKVLLVGAKAEVIKAEKERDENKSNHHLILTSLLISILLLLWLLFKNRQLKRKMKTSA